MGLDAQPGWDRDLNEPQEALDRKPKVLAAQLFGSLARGEASAASDVDIAIYLNDGAKRSCLNFERGADLMSRLGHNDLEVVLLCSAPPLLYHRVLRDGERSPQPGLMVKTRRRGQALSGCCDWEPQVAKIDAAHRHRVAAGAAGE